MRPAILSAYMQMMPVIQAREAREEIRRSQAGNGLMSREQWREYDRQLRHDENRGVRQKAKKATAAQLGFMGIQVVNVDG